MRDQPHAIVIQTTGFGGLAGVGISVRFRRVPQGIEITRAPWQMFVGLLALLGFLIAPMYFIGSDGIRLLLSGDFGGDRWFVALVAPILIFIAGLFIRSTFTRRPVALISRDSRTIHYDHPGYDQQNIAARDIESIGVTEVSAMGRGDLGRNVPNAITVRLKHGIEVNIATHKNRALVVEMCAAIADLLAVKVTS